ncbi:hypothetical protein SLH46_11820 [Draconibacterium sp. IB214405]|uniref:hypothetical protein n=1 Tax=Draconibacterium sp. IB214405 TaxID=3097352 RepID=UPI002A130A03|nr:hypothetical protein [Draconibacterium sp. IB214405]MDX8339876.1 hypothetical protein [Draconibacterium sp. IB214405]
MKKALLLLFFFGALSSQAQEFKYQLLFEGIGDNREFTHEYAYPQTIMGSRGAFEVGVDIDNHQLRGGLSQLLEFGSDLDAQKPKLTLYYQFQDEDKEFAFGAFPRRDKINFPLAMLTDTLLYYRPNIEGMFGEFRWDWGHQNGFVDWVGRQTDTQREQFMAGFSGEIFYKNFFFQNYLLMFHNAHTLYNNPPLHIKDYMGFALQGGIRTPENITVQGELKMGVLNSTYRERSVTDGYEVSTSFFAEANMRYKNLGIKSVMSLGAGHKFAYGDPYYRTKNYSRTDLIWYFINHEQIKGKFNLSMHIVDWETIDQQQQLSIIYIFGQ